jgi:hypothetical protein
MKSSVNIKGALVTLVTTLFLFVSCTTNKLTGQTIKESRELPSFTGIVLSFSGNIYITQGSAQKVEIEADKDDIPIIISEIHNNALVLKTKDVNWHNMGTVKVYITVSELNYLSVAGSGDILCQNDLKSGSIEMSVSGSGSIELKNLRADDTHAEITGSGDIRLTGDTEKELKVTITGSGSFNASALPAEKVDVNITGSGSATVNAVSNLYTNITGSGSVFYKGNPTIDANATGSGRTKSIN